MFFRETAPDRAVDVQNPDQLSLRIENRSNNLTLRALGYSHEIHMMLPAEVKAEVPEIKKGETPKLVLKSCDKQLVGQVAAKIRSFRKPAKPDYA